MKFPSCQQQEDGPSAGCWEQRLTVMTAEGRTERKKERQAEGREERGRRECQFGSAAPPSVGVRQQLLAGSSTVTDELSMRITAELSLPG